MTLLPPLIAGPPTLIHHPLSRELCQGIGCPSLKDSHRPPRHGTTERLLFCRNPNG